MRQHRYVSLITLVFIVCASDAFVTFNFDEPMPLTLGRLWAVLAIILLPVQLPRLMLLGAFGFLSYPGNMLLSTAGTYTLWLAIDFVIIMLYILLWMMLKITRM